jgi:hypothetical protein
MRNTEKIGRDDWIRTSDPLNPIYRAVSSVSTYLGCGYPTEAQKHEANKRADLATGWHLVAIAAIALAGCWLWIVCTHQKPSDFILMRETTSALMAGRPAYASGGAGIFVDLNAPMTHALLVPLIGLSDQAAVWLWRGLNALCFVGAIALVTPFGWTTRRGWFVTAAFVASPATVLELAAGQIAGVLTLGLAVAWRYRERRLGSLTLGFVIAAKPFLAPVLLWAWRRGERRLAIYGALGTSLSFVVGIALFGAGATTAWVAALHSVVWTASEFNASLFRFGPAAVVVGAIVIGGVALADVAEDWFPLAILGSLLLSPLGWIYYLWLPAPWLIRRALQQPWPIWTMSLWVPIHFALMPPAGFSILRWSYPLGLIGLFAWLVRASASGTASASRAARG